MKNVVFYTKPRSRLIYNKLINAKFNKIKSMIVTYFELNSIEYNIQPINKLLTYIGSPETIIIINETNLNNEQPAVISNIKKKYAKSKIISVALCEKYKSIENKLYYLTKTFSIRDSIFLGMEQNSVKIVNGKIAIDDINNNDKFVEDLKKTFNIVEIKLEKLDYDICIFTQIPSSYLLIQELRCNGTKIVFTFNCLSYVDSAIFEINNNISSLRKFNTILNSPSSKLIIQNNMSQLFDEFAVTKKSIPIPIINKPQQFRMLVNKISK